MNRLMRQIIVKTVTVSILVQSIAQPVFAITRCDEATLNQDQIRELVKKERADYTSRLDTYVAREYFATIGRRVESEIFEKCKSSTTCSPQEVYNITKSVLEKLYLKASSVDATTRKLKSGIIFVSLVVAYSWGSAELNDRINDKDSIFSGQSWLAGLLGVVIRSFALKFGYPLLDFADAKIKRQMYEMRAGKSGVAPISKESREILTATADRMNAGLNDIERGASTMVFFFGSNAAGTFRQLKPLSNDGVTFRNELEQVAQRLSNTTETSRGTDAHRALESRHVELKKNIDTNDTETASILAELSFTARTQYSYIQPDLPQIAFYIDNAYEPQNRPLELRKKMLEMTVSRLKAKDREFRTNHELETFYRNLIGTWLQIP